MNNRIEYIIDLRISKIDAETAAILAAYYDICYFIGKADEAEQYLEVSEDLTLFCVGHSHISDTARVLEFKFDLSSCYIAEVIDDKLNIIKKYYHSNLITEFRSKGNSNIYETNRLSKYSENFNHLFTDASLCSFVKYFVLAMDNISHKELNIFCGSSGLTDVDIHNCKHDTYKAAIQFKEVSTLTKYYDSVISNITVHKSLKKLIKARKIKLAALLNSFYTSSGAFVTYSGYPVIFKYLAAYLFLCSRYKSHFEMFNSAFLFAFRSLDWLCDGLLIMFGDATISSSGSKHDEFFLIANGTLKKPMGFGVKWQKVKSNPMLINLGQANKDALDNYLQIRNRHVMTHGSLRINRSYFEAFNKLLIQFYKEIDNEINSNGFTFLQALDVVDEIFTINYSDLLFNSLCHEFSYDLKCTSLV